MKLVQAVDGWAITRARTFDRPTARRGLGEAAACQGPSSLYQTAHPSTASVPITVLLYNGPLLCGFNVPIKGLMTHNVMIN